MDPGVSDLLANGPGEWWRDSGFGLERVSGFSVPTNKFDLIARAFIGIADRHLDQLSPAVDASIGASQLPVLVQSGISSIRVHATLQSAISGSTRLAFRVHRAEVFSLDELQESGMFGPQQKSQLQTMLRQRANFLISGPTGSGKTTLLRSLLASTPELRTVVVEDSAELVPVAGHVLGLQARQPNVEGAGGIDLEFLARQALRMRPDRIMVGEVRGPEAAVLLNAMNTGHAGSAATIHANSASGVVARLRALVPLSAMSDQTFRSAANAALDAVIHLEAQPVRRLAAIEVFEC